MKRDKEGHYVMIKGSIQEEDITIINIYALNIGASQYVRQMLTSIKGFFYVDDHVICKQGVLILLFQSEFLLFLFLL